MILKQPPATASRPAPRPLTPGLTAILALSALALLALGAALADHAALAVQHLRWYLLPEAPPATGEAADVDRLYLRIEWNDLARLERKRREALRIGVLLASSDDYVPAWVGLGDPESRLLRAKVRLKGDWVEHVRGDRWSLRVKLRGDGRLFGMKTLSLQLPERRGGIHGWIFHEAMRRAGLVSPRFRFVRLFLNETDLGVYAAEEHFDSRLIEHNRFRPGPILSFDESLDWEVEAGLGRATPGVSHEAVAGIRPFSRSRMVPGGEDREAYFRAASLLAGFRGGELSAARAFDVDKVALHYALSDLLGAHHGLSWINFRFYFNPITARLEPVAFDGDAGQRLTDLAYHARAGLDRLWRDDGFVRSYFAALERLSQPAFLDELFADLEPELRRNEEILRAGVPERPGTRPRDVYAGNQATIRAYLRPLRALAAHVAAVGSTRVELDLMSSVRLPLEVVALEHPGRPPLAPATGALLEPYAPGPLRVDRVVFEVPEEARGAWTDVAGAELAYRVAGTSTVLGAPLTRWPAPRPRALPRDLLAVAPGGDTSELEALPFVVVEAEPPRARILPGEWTLSRPLAVPPGLTLTAGPGTTLELVDGAAVLSYSPLELRGRPGEPVVLRATGEGQGLVVLNAGPSVLEHVRFEGLAAPRGAGWAMTGAVTFYQSPAELSAVSFVANRDSDDALNVVRSELKLADCLFLDTPSDAIDVDFGWGSIADCRFERVGGDGVDTSGSTLTLTGSTFSHVGDKAVSAGERSRVRFRGLEIDHCALALVSKDDSELRGSGAVLSECAVGFAAFRKKPEYGPGSLAVQGYEASGLETLYQLEEGSEIVLDEEPMAVNAENLRQRFYTAEAP